MRLIILLCLLPCALSIDYLPKANGVKETALGTVRAKRSTDCMDFFAHSTLEEFGYSKGVKILNYTGHEDCANDRCVIHAQCQFNMVNNQTSETERLYVCRGGKWEFESQGKRDFTSTADDFFTCCVAGAWTHTSMIFPETEETGKEQFHIGQEIYFMKYSEWMYLLEKHRYAECRITNHTLLYYPVSSYTAGVCDALTADNRAGVTPFHDDETLSEEERFAKFGIAQRMYSGEEYWRIDSARSYAHGRGLRFFCDENFAGTNSKTMDVVCDVPDFNKETVSELGIWKDRNTGNVFDMSQCSAWSSTVPDYECIPPNFECEYYIADRTDCDATDGNIGCVLSVMCANGNHPAQRFKCQFDQGWQWTKINRFIMRKSNKHWTAVNRSLLIDKQNRTIKDLHVKDPYSCSLL